MNQKPYKHKWWVCWLASWVGLSESIVGVLTLGYIRPSWELGFWWWAMTRAAEFAKAKGKECTND